MLWGNDRAAGVQIVKIFPGGRFTEPELLHHPILRKALKLRSNTPVPHDYQPRFIGLGLGYTVHCQNHGYADFPPPPYLFGAVPLTF